MTDEFSFAAPLIRPIAPERAHTLYQDKLIADIGNWGGKLPLRNNEYFLSNSELVISLYEDPSEYAPFNQFLNPPSVRDHYLFVFKVNGEICEEKISNLINSIPKEDKHREALIEYYKQDAPLHSIALEINNFFLTANIAFPGALSTEEGVGFISENKRVGLTGLYAESLYLALDSAKKSKWPELQDISILEAWNWLNTSNCLVHGIGEGPLGRALASFSRLIKESYRDDSSLDIVWALLGLESIYTKGNVGLKEQLVSKTELLLGKREQNKTAFGKMYDFRSRLVHGDIDIPLSYSPYDATEKFENFHSDLYQNSEIAIATLIATFQNMIKNNWKALEFTYAVQGS